MQKKKEFEWLSEEMEALAVNNGKNLVHLPVGRLLCASLLCSGKPIDRVLWHSKSMTYSALNGVIFP